MNQVTKPTLSTTKAARMARESALRVMATKSGQTVQTVTRSVDKGVPLVCAMFDKLITEAIERVIRAHYDGDFHIRPSSLIPHDSIVRTILK